MPTRSISIVLPTRNRPDDVRRSVPTLLATSADRILIVDQSTDDATRSALEEIGALDDRRVVYIPSDERGVSRARNTGMRACDTDIIVFTDDDCTVPPSWVRDLGAAMAEGGYDLLFAPVIEPDDRDGLEGWIPEFRPVSIGAVAPSADPIDSFGFTANMAATSRLIDAIGLFDEWLGPGSEHNLGGEDTDFGYRALLAGFVVGVTDAPAVRHYGVRSGRALHASRQTYERGFAAFLDKHARLGDRAARDRLRQGFRAPIGQAANQLIRLRRPSGLGTASACVSAIFTGRRHYRVDPETRLYVQR